MEKKGKVLIFVSGKRADSLLFPVEDLQEGKGGRRGFSTTRTVKIFAELPAGREKANSSLI